MDWALVQVEAYSGYRAGERPLRFVLAGERHEVTGIVDRWYEGGKSPKDPKLDYYKVRTASGDDYLLRYNTLFDTWSASRVHHPVTMTD